MPLPYVTRTTYFAGLELRCDDRALVPRQETEQLVEAVLQRLPDVAMQPGECLADVGCGNGAIGLALATQAPDLHVVMTDLSAEAVELAAENTRHLGMSGRVTLRVGSYLEPLREADLVDRVAVVVCNPPYVRPAEMSMLDAEVHAEPRLAITGPDADGMAGYRVLATQVGGLPNLRLLAFEVGFAQEEDVAGMFAQLGRIEILADFAGIERMVVVHVG
jgi:release factor glutamine methyltransferase